VFIMDEGQYLNYKEWEKMANTITEPEDYGYLALYLSIMANVSCEKALIALKGEVTRP
jgi:hypothetical protein